MEQMDALLENAMPSDKAVRVAGHIKHLHCGITRSEPFRQYSPVYSRHYDVSEQQMNGFRILRGDTLSLRAVSCRQDLVSVVPQKHVRQFPQRFGVFHQEDGLASTNC